MSKRVIGTLAGDERIYVVLDDGSCYAGYDTGGALSWMSTTAVPGSFAHDWPRLAEPRSPVFGNDAKATRAS